MQIWQATFLASVVAWTLIRDWPWTHTVFFVLHGIVMVMKQHSYAFYNGYLSTVYEKRLFLLSKLKQLERVDPASCPSTAAPPARTLDTSHLGVPPSAAQRRHSLAQLTSDEETDIDRVARAIAERQPLDDEQISLFGRIIKWEVDALADELRGTATDATQAYPRNLTFVSHYKWIPLPTVVYELGYPHTERISWPYVAEKLVAMVGILFVMIQVSQYSICESPSPPMRGLTILIDPLVRPRRDEDDADEGGRSAAVRAIQRGPLASERPHFPLYDGVSGMSLAI